MMAAGTGGGAGLILAKRGFISGMSIKAEAIPEPLIRKSLRFMFDIVSILSLGDRKQASLRA
jgi:hypothetical protein